MELWQWRGDQIKTTLKMKGHKMQDEWRNRGGREPEAGWKLDNLWRLVHNVFSRHSLIGATSETRCHAWEDSILDRARHYIDMMDVSGRC